ncbi:unnamed protein product [Closterium sp. NIES-64]|nr:unnamed protein product [Closterium sp. NIES-64]
MSQPTISQGRKGEQAGEQANAKKGRGRRKRGGKKAQCATEERRKLPDGFSADILADKGEADGGEADEGEADEGEADEREADDGEADEGESDEDEADEGESDEGEADESESDEGDADEGEADEGEADEGEADEGEADEGEADEGGEGDDQSGIHSADLLTGEGEEGEGEGAEGGEAEGVGAVGEEAEGEGAEGGEWDGEEGEGEEGEGEEGEGEEGEGEEGEGEEGEGEEGEGEEGEGEEGEGEEGEGEEGEGEEGGGEEGEGEEGEGEEGEGEEGEGEEGESVGAVDGAGEEVEGEQAEGEEADGVQADGNNVGEGLSDYSNFSAEERTNGRRTRVQALSRRSTLDEDEEAARVVKKGRFMILGAAPDDTQQCGNGRGGEAKDKQGGQTVKGALAAAKPPTKHRTSLNRPDLSPHALSHPNPSHLALTLHQSAVKNSGVGPPTTIERFNLGGGGGKLPQLQVTQRATTSAMQVGAAAAPAGMTVARVGGAASTGGRVGAAAASTGVKVGAAAASTGGRVGAVAASTGVRVGGAAAASTGGRVGAAAASTGGRVGGAAASTGGRVGAAAASTGGRVGAAAASTGGRVGGAAASTGGRVGGAAASTGGRVGGAAASTGGRVGGVAASTGGRVGGAAASTGGRVGGAAASTGGRVGGAAASTGGRVGGAAASTGGRVGGAAASTGGRVGAAAASTGVFRPRGTTTVRTPPPGPTALAAVSTRVAHTQWVSRAEFAALRKEMLQQFESLRAQGVAVPAQGLASQGNDATTGVPRPPSQSAGQIALEMVIVDAGDWKLCSPLICHSCSVPSCALLSCSVPSSALPSCLVSLLLCTHHAMPRSDEWGLKWHVDQITQHPFSTKLFAIAMSKAFRRRRVDVTAWKTRMVAFALFSSIERRAEPCERVPRWAQERVESLPGPGSAAALSTAQIGAGNRTGRLLFGVLSVSQFQLPPLPASSPIHLHSSNLTHSSSPIHPHPSLHTHPSSPIRPHPSLLTHPSPPIRPHPYVPTHPSPPIRPHPSTVEGLALVFGRIQEDPWATVEGLATVFGRVQEDPWAVHSNLTQRCFANYIVRTQFARPWVHAIAYMAFVNGSDRCVFLSGREATSEAPQKAHMSRPPLAWVHAIACIAFVNGSDRATFERRMGCELVDLLWRRSPPANWYMDVRVWFDSQFPLALTVGYSQCLDGRLNPSYGPQLTRVKETAEKMLTTPYVLSNGHPGMGMVFPIFKGSVTAASPLQDRQAALIGVVAASVDFSRLADFIILEVLRQGADYSLEVYDVTPTDLLPNSSTPLGPRLLYGVGDLPQGSFMQVAKLIPPSNETMLQPQRHKGSDEARSMTAVFLGVIIVVVAALLAGIAVSVTINTRRLREKTAAVERLKESAEVAERNKSAFIASTAHELRTPINGMEGMLKQLDEGGLDGGQRGDVGAAVEEAERILRLVNAVLDVCKAEAGRLHLESLPFALRPWLRDVLLPHEQAAQERGLELTWRVDGDVPGVLVGDYLRLQQQVVDRIVGE